MKNKLVLILFIAFVNQAYSQHEGIERHFNSHTLYIIPYEDLTYVEDTLTDFFHNYLPQYKQTYNPLGWLTPGSPFIPAIYSEQTTHTFWFLNNYTPYIQDHDNIVYFDATKPFTIFKFYGGPKSPEIVKFLHTQNITPYFNFAFNYDLVNSNENNANNVHYQRNITKTNSISIAAAYTKKKYQSHFNFLYNKINHQENGGLKDLHSFESTDFPTNLYGVNLENAQNSIGQIGLQYNHELRFGTYSSDTILIGVDTAINKVLNSNFSIIHDIKADRFFRQYIDIPGEFYSNIYRDSSLTNDSTYYKVIDNKILLNFLLEGKGKIEKFQILAGINNYLYNYGFDSTSQTYLSNYVTGSLTFETENSSFYSELNYCFAGTDIFDTDISAEYYLDFTDNTNLSAYFGFSVLNPSIFMYYYKSNHFEWDIDAYKTTNISGGANFNFSEIYLDAGVNINIPDNYFIMDTAYSLRQIAAANLVADAYVSKTFNFGNFHWYTKFTYQYITNREYIPLPDMIGYTSFYFKRDVFKNALTLQLGFDIKYHSAIYGYGYLPALGVFYLQNDSKFGNYPNAGIYGVVKRKRLRGFVKISNINSTFMPRTYYLLYKIPDNPFAFNFGISWEFYD
ncbi:MAG TPA: hypothetical protein PLL66_03300 [Bacteroidales bacterium]|nr:hypothetical protein [Bacteroidales bacterium]